MNFTDLTEKQQNHIVAVTYRTRQAFTTDPNADLAWDMYLCSADGQALLAGTCGTRPVPFSGTDAEARDNFNTHYFAFDGDDARCVKCDSKDWHAAASYPCGEEPPREFFDPATGLTVYGCMGG